MRTGAFFLGLSVALAGCSTINTGEIDYRRAEPAPPVDVNVTNHRNGGLCPPVDFKGLATDVSRQCAPLLPARLIRKYAGMGDPIRANEVYSIRLEQGLIAYLAEPPFSMRRLGRGGNPFHAIGEIVILAQTFEFADSAEAAKGRARFVDLTSLNDVRVIYYSPDIEEGQTLNFSNIPIQSPTKYGGRPIGIQIVVLELDRMSTPLKSMMNELAGLGASTSLVTGSPAAKILLDIGSSLLTKDNDDVIFDYRFVLDPSSGEMSSDVAPFEAGRYVMRRTDDRSDEQIWRNVVLDHNTGRLMQTDAAGKKFAEYDDDTWFTINVVKHDDKTESFYDFGTFAELSDAIAASADARDAPFTAVAAQVNKITQDRRSQSWAKDLGAAARNMTTAYRIYGRRIADKSTIPAPCKIKTDAAVKEANAKISAEEAALVFVETYNRSLADTMDGKAADGTAIKLPVTSIPDRRAALSSLASYFTPFDAALQITSAQLINPPQFENVYLTDGGAGLIAQMDLVAQNRLKAKDCATAIDFHLADP